MQLAFPALALALAAAPADVDRCKQALAVMPVPKGGGVAIIVWSPEPPELP